MQVRAITSALGARLVQVGPAFWLALVWLLAAYRAGGYLPRTWLPLALVIGFAGLLTSAFRAHVRPSSKLLLLVLGLSSVYVLWMALSVTWAMGPGPAWEEAARAGFYLVFFALALAYLGGRRAREAAPSKPGARPAPRVGATLQPGARAGGRSLLLAAGLVIVVIALYRFAFPGEGDFFLARRLGFPLAYPNGAGSFYLLLAWPLLWLAADPGRRLWVRALSLGTIAALVQLAILTQSRGVAATLGMSALVYFLLTPARLRSLVFLAIPALPAALSFGPLTAYYSAGAGAVDRAVALSWLTGSFAAAAVAGLFLSRADRRVRITSRVHAATSVVIIVALLAGASLGVLELRDRVGDLSEWASETASTFVGDEGAGESGGGEGRFGDLGGNGRGLLWRTAWEGFLDSPIVGNGAGSYRYLNELHRTDPTVTAQQAHSIELDILNETGIVGMALFVSAFGTALGIVLAPRFRSWWALIRRRRPLLLSATASYAGDRTSVGDQAWIAALTGALLFYFVHASVDWTWHFPGVTLGAFLLLAYALSTAVTPQVERPTPPGRRGLSGPLFRIGLGIVSLAVLVGAGLPYLSSQYENAALARMRTDTKAALGRASTAHILFPVSSEPLLVRANIYQSAAGNAAALDDAAERATGVRDALALALVACERAAEKESASYRVHFESGLAALDLLAARDARAVYGESARRWAGLGTTADAGESAVMRLAGEGERSGVAEILALSGEELLARAQEDLKTALARNPLDAQLKEITRVMEGGTAAGG